MAETSFLGESSKRRRVANPDLIYEDSNYGTSSLGGTEQSNSRADDTVPDIFLSHSGMQKPFVERLYNDLRRANHTVFFDQHSLEKGFTFPPRIEKAARGCKIGVVVLSEEFLTSKWPMLELDMLVSQRGPEPCVLPLFYKLKTEDLSSSENLLRWRGVWEEKVGGNVSKKWEQVVKDLKHFNGEVFRQGSEDAYIKKVVERICGVIPCHVPYDCSYIQGQLRLTKEIEEKFERLDASKTRMVGLHGVGGLGKTTLCKAMVNYYSSYYRGKSVLIEFPSFGGSASSMITLECRKALYKLIDASYEHLLNKIDSFDEVVQLMRDCVGHHDVFLAIDNVWESSLEEAERVLGVGFSANSRILVTSRSEQVLKHLLMVGGPAKNADVASLPAPVRAEAFQIFQENFKSYDLSALKDINQMDSFLGRCTFSNSYHALALKALAKYVKRVFINADLEEIEHDLLGVLEEISSEDLSDVEDVIRLNYDNLPEQKKHIFLDIVVYIEEIEWWIWDGDGDGDVVGFDRNKYAKVQEWISSLYGKFPKSKTTRLINELSLDGLIQIEVEEDGTKRIGLHDLYHEFAMREIASSPRFWIHGITKSVEKIEREKLVLVIVDAPDVCLFEELQQCKCPELKVLMACGMKIKSGIIWLDSMPSLSVLSLEDISLVENDAGSDLEKEVVAQSHNLQQPLEQAPGMPSLDQEGTIKNSRIGFVWGEAMVHAPRVLHLHGVGNLRKLTVWHCSFFEEIAGLDALGNLHMLHVSCCKRLKSLDGLSGLVQLQVLLVNACDSLQKLPDVSGLTCLERLKLFCNDAMEEVGGEYFSSTLKRLEILSCSRLRSCPSLDECLHLETLTTVCKHHISSLQKLPNLHTSLKGLFICARNGDCLTIKKIDVGCFTNLEELRVSNCKALEEIEYFCALGSLSYLKIWDLPSLKKLNVGCFSLKTLSVHDCKALEIIGDFSALPSLKEMYISECPSLKTGGHLINRPRPALVSKRV